MGVVYLARHEPLRRLVALKLLRVTALCGDAVRFRTEAEAVARLQHPNIVQVFEVGEHDGRPFLALEYVGGGSLAEAVRGKPQPPAEAAALVEALARAVQHAHERGVVHRDLKPSNVLLQRTEDRGQRTEQGGSSLSSVPCPLSSCVPKVADFGLARLLDASASLQAVVGTPCYMAPEQVLGQGRAVGPAADVYGLGAVLYELLTGRPPFLADSPQATMMQAVAADPAPPRRLVSSCPADLEAVCLKCLEKRPQRRYASAADLADDLGRFRRGEPTHARPPGPLGRAARWARRRPAAAALVAVSVAAFLALVGGGAWFTARLAQERADAQQERNHAVEAGNDARAQKKTAEDERDRAKFQAARAEHARHALQLGLALQAWDRHDLVTAERALGEVDEAFQQTWEQRYVRALCRRKALALVGHIGPVTCLAFSRDGARLASGSADRTIRVWDLATGRTARTLEGHTDKVAAVCFSPDGRTVYSGGHDKTVRVWDAETGRLIRVLQGHTQPVTRVVVSDDGQCLVSGWGKGAFPSGEIKVWDATTGDEKFALGAGAVNGEGVALSPDGKRLACGVHRPLPRAADTEVVALKIWDVETGREVATLLAPRSDGHNFCICRTAFSRDGKSLVTGCLHGSVRVWDLPGGQPRPAGPGNHPTILHLQATADGRHRVFSAAGPEVVVRDAASGQVHFSLAGHAGKVLALAVSSDEKRIATAGDDRVVKVWDVAAPRGTALASPPVAMPDRRPPPGPYSCSAVSADGRRCVLGHGTGRVALWDVVEGREVWAAEDERGIEAVAVSADGRVAASLNIFQEARVWKDGRARDLGRVERLRERIPTVALSPDGLRVVTAGHAGPLTVWDAESGRALFTLEEAAFLGFDPTSRRLLVRHDRQVKLLDAGTGAALRALAGPTRDVSCAAFERSGKRLATGGSDGVLRIWDAETCQEKLACKARVGPLVGVAFGGDGRWLVSGSRDGTVRIWDTETGQEKLLLHRPPSRAAFSIAVSDDGARVVVGGDATVHVWEAERASGDRPGKGNAP
jgi:WD40 repeat protein